MENIVNVIVQNGLGVASFIALLYFMNTSLKGIKDSVEKTSETLLLIQTNLMGLENRITGLEDKIEREYNDKIKDREE